MTGRIILTVPLVRDPASAAVSTYAECFRRQYEAAFEGWLIFLSCNTHMLGRLWGFRCLRGGVLRRGTQRGPRGRQIGRRAAACAGRLWAWRERVTRPSFQLRCVCHRSQAGVVSHARSLRNAVRVGRGGLEGRAGK